jgi:hypothetical protein
MELSAIDGAFFDASEDPCDFEIWVALVAASTTSND